MLDFFTLCLWQRGSLNLINLLKNVGKDAPQFLSFSEYGEKYHISLTMACNRFFNCSTSCERTPVILDWQMISNYRTKEICFVFLYFLLLPQGILWQLVDHTKRYNKDFSVGICSAFFARGHDVSSQAKSINVLGFFGTEGSGSLDWTSTGDLQNRVCEALQLLYITSRKILWQS